MASSTSTLAPQRGLRLLPAITKLAGWRFKQMWRFLLVTWLGMLAMVVIACALPLFSRVAISADLHQVIANAPDGQKLTVMVQSLYPTSSQVQQAAQAVDKLVKQGSIGAHLQAAPQLIVQTPPIHVSTANKRSDGLVLDGYDPTQTAQHVTLLQGKLPQETSGDTIEIALTQTLATNLGLHVDSLIYGYPLGAAREQTWSMRVVGIIAPKEVNDPFWLVPANPFGSLYSVTGGATAHNVLAARETIRGKIAALQTLPGKDPSFLFWSYPFNQGQLDANNVSTLSQDAEDLAFQVTYGGTLTGIAGIAGAQVAGSLIFTLANYAKQVLILEVVTTFLLLLILGIVLFLVGMMADVLVERQAEIISTLRSRGATRRHVFGTFVMQGLIVGLAALLAGPLLAIVCVALIARALLTPAGQQSISVITSNPLQTALDVKWYALIAIVVALVVMIFAISRSSKLDIVTLRRESARTRQVTFWRRFNLDLFVVLLLIASYILYNYLWQSLMSAQSFDPLIYNMLKIGGFVAPPLIVAGLMMLFLRILPLILRLTTWLAAKRRSAPAVLAFAQMERTPRPAARIIVLLALAVASSCFLLTLMMTKQVRTSDAAAYSVGADFSGNLPTSDSDKTFDALKTQYSAMSGVQTATIGYFDTLDGVPADINLMAVDADTYAKTAQWPSGNASQSLPGLMSQLVAHRADAAAHDEVYALVDDALWQSLGLTPGASFVMPMNDTGTPKGHFIALAHINNVVGTYDTAVDPESNVGMVVDYQSYATVYQKDIKTALVPNYVWLSTKDDAASLASIRKALPTLQDRRMLTVTNQENSVHVDVIGVLMIGVGAAIILALIGTLLSSWLNASSRLTSFAVVRALGMTPRQIAAFLLWEQGFIYILSLLLGLGLGALLLIFVGPAVSLLDLTGSTAQDNPYDLPPPQIVIPYLPLGLLLGGIVIICAVALFLMARIVSRPSIGQTLRLNED